MPHCTIPGVIPLPFPHDPMLAVADSLGDVCEAVGGSRASTITMQLSSTWSCHKKDSFIVPANPNVRIPTIRQPCEWDPTWRRKCIAWLVPISLRQRWRPIGVSDRLMCSGHKAGAQISPEFRHRSSFHRSSFQPKQHSMALSLCIGCSTTPPPPSTVIPLHELKLNNYYHNFYKCFLTSERKR